MYIKTRSIENHSFNPFTTEKYPQGLNAKLYPVIYLLKLVIQFRERSGNFHQQWTETKNNLNVF